MDTVQDTPRDRISVEEVWEKAADIAQFDRFQAMAGLVLLLEDFLEALDVLSLELAEALAEQAKEPLVSSLLGASVQDHVAQLDALVLFDVHSEKLVGTLLEVERRLDC